MSIPSSSSDLYDGPRIEPQAIVLSLLGFISFSLLVPPFILNVKNHNLPNATLIASVALINLQNTINPMIWPNDDIDSWFSGNIFCDVEAKLQVALAASIPASASCICRNLALILSSDRTMMAGSSRACQNQRIVELLLCVALPICLMAVHILVEPYRYFVFGITGCLYSELRGWMTVLVFLLWLILLSLFGSLYCVLIIVRLIKHQRQVASLLAGAQLSKARFMRVFILATVCLVTYTPLILYTYIPQLHGGFIPYDWKLVHPSSWNEQIVLAKSYGVVGFEQWLQIVYGLAIFVVFGLGNDAVVVYKSWVKVAGLQKLLCLSAVRRRRKSVRKIQSREMDYGFRR